MRWLSGAAAMLLVLPGVAAAQGQSPFPDHWLTLDAFASQLALTADQRASVDAPLAGVNAILLRATQRRDELAAEFRGLPRVSQMSDADRRGLEDRLKAIAAEYAGRQAELDQSFAAIRAQLTPGQQVSFDALRKPRLIPAAAQP